VAPAGFNNGVQIVISRASFRSLIDSYLDPDSNLEIITKSDKFTVEQLEDLIEGYQTAYRQKDTVEIESHIFEVKELTFDPTFGNVAFLMSQKHLFKNPFNAEYLSAKVVTAAQCVLKLTVNEKMDLLFEVEVKQERVQKWQAYFKTETESDDFNEEFKATYSKHLLKSLNSELVKGVRVPFSHTQSHSPFDRKP
jgi:hypothetical protein